MMNYHVLPLVGTVYVLANVVTVIPPCRVARGLRGYFREYRGCPAQHLVSWATLPAKHVIRQKIYNDAFLENNWVE